VGVIGSIVNACVDHLLAFFAGLAGIFISEMYFFFVSKENLHNIYIFIHLLFDKSVAMLFDE
jgi:hypothetical protein